MLQIVQLVLLPGDTCPVLGFSWEGPGQVITSRGPWCLCHSWFPSVGSCCDPRPLVWLR